MYCIARVSSFQYPVCVEINLSFPTFASASGTWLRVMGVSMSQPKPTPRTASGLNIDPRLPPLVFGLWLFGILVLVLGISRVAPVAPGESRRLVDWAYLGFLFRHVNPYLFTAMGIASSIGLSVLGAAWCVPPTIAPASPPTLDAQIHRESSAVFLELQFANIHPSPSFVSQPAGESSSRGARSRAGRFAPRASPARTSYPSSSVKPSPSTA